MMYAGTIISYTALHRTTRGFRPVSSFKLNRTRQMLLLTGTWYKAIIISLEILSGQQLITWASHRLVAGIIPATYLVSTGSMIFSPGMAPIAVILIWPDGESRYHITGTCCIIIQRS